MGRLRNLLVGSIATAALATSAFADIQRFQRAFIADLAGGQETADVTTDTTGRVRVSFDPGLSQFRAVVVVLDGSAISAAHIHCAEAGQDGPVVVTLFDGPTQDVDGVLVDATFDNGDVAITSCGAEGFEVNNVASLLAALRKDLLYVNVHSEANAAGEVRGQLFDGGDDDDSDSDSDSDE